MTNDRLKYILLDLNRASKMLAHPSPITGHFIVPSAVLVNQARHDLFAALYGWRSLRGDPDGPWDTKRLQTAFLKGG